MATIEFQQFTCVRDDRALFEPLTWQAQPGVVAQILGPNGAGKTTLLRALSGLFDNTQGALLWDGEPIAQKGYERDTQLLYLGHHPGVKGVLSATENLAWYQGINDVAPQDLEEALAMVGLSGFEDTPCHHLSAGQQRRVALARLFVTQKPVWVLDEPFTAIDVAGIAKLEALMVAHAQNGGIVFVTSHQTITCDGLVPIQLMPMAGNEE